MPEKKEGGVDHMFCNMSLGAHAVQGVVIEIKKQLSDPKLGYAELACARYIGA